jgi:molybdopterin-binding protein
VATERPLHISARNILPATIERLHRRDVMFLAEAALSDGPSALRLEVHLTPGAVDSLALGPGSQIWLVIKTHSCRVLKPSR